tara:strand:- start:19 stop:420 length:402 start_codon:yes stop_codon:yes gene_type:complete
LNVSVLISHNEQSFRDAFNLPRIEYMSAPANCAGVYYGFHRIPDTKSALRLNRFKRATEFDRFHFSLPLSFLLRLCAFASPTLLIASPIASQSSFVCVINRSGEGGPNESDKREAMPLAILSLPLTRPHAHLI